MSQRIMECARSERVGAVAFAKAERIELAARESDDLEQLAHLVFGDQPLAAVRCAGRACSSGTRPQFIRKRACDV